MKPGIFSHIFMVAIFALALFLPISDKALIYALMVGISGLYIKD